MKIIFTIDHMTIGGAQRVCYNLLMWLLSHNEIDVHLIIYRNLIVGDVEYDLSQIAHTYLPENKIDRILGIRKLIKSYKPDLLVSFGTPNTLFDIPAVFLTGVKTIVCERNDPAHFAGKLRTKIFSRLLMRRADGYVYQTSDAQLYYGNIFVKKSVVIPNPLFRIEELPIKHYEGVNTRKIVSVGRLNVQKNYPMLIKAFKSIHNKYSDYKLIIYGDGPEKNNLLHLIHELGLENIVSLPGATNQVIKEIQDASVFILSSNFEGMPNALMEAMSLGLPCVSTDCPCGGPRDLIENGKNGMLIPVGDENALVNAIFYLIEQEEIANQLGVQAMQIRNRYSLDVIGQKWIDFFQIIVN